MAAQPILVRAWFSCSAAAANGWIMHSPIGRYRTSLTESDGAMDKHSDKLKMEELQ
ncbi:hypothetical protein X737_37970 [Mesorhizobium sp. L48C026A00]|nr:hypothetical protein X737_37970 [Mesorhizobium sp. L48C026A00]